jgi:hypothetical protein
MPYKIIKIDFNPFQDTVCDFISEAEKLSGQRDLYVKLTQLSYKIIFYLNALDHIINTTINEHNKYSVYLKSKDIEEEQKLSNIFTVDGKTTEATVLQELVIVNLPSLLLGYYAVLRIFLDFLNVWIAENLFQDKDELPRRGFSFSKLWEQPLKKFSAYRVKPGVEIDYIYKVANRIDHEIVEVRDCLIHEHPRDSIYLSPDHRVQIRLKYHKNKEEKYADILGVINENSKLFLELLKLLIVEIKAGYISNSGT